MSRYRSGRLVYGFDPCGIPGYFAQVLDEDDEIVENLDTRHFLSDRVVYRGDILDLLVEHDAPEEHRNCLALDLPF